MVSVLSEHTLALYVQLTHHKIQAEAGIRDLGMTAATATLSPTMVSPTTNTLDDIQKITSSSVGTNARKRRRQILQTQRLKSEPVSKKPFLEPQAEKVVATASPKKKTQMRYDPEVPMSKEEAAAWRRDQRRKRNRESAAASRQRQRDRITELEGEVDEWKKKYEAAMARLQALEDQQGNKSLTVPTSTTPLEATNSQPISPCPSPTLSYVTPATSSTVSVDSSRQTEGTAMHLIETISRPA